MVHPDVCFHQKPPVYTTKLVLLVKQETSLSLLYNLLNVNLLIYYTSKIRVCVSMDMLSHNARSRSGRGRLACIVRMPGGV